jgi:transcriptional regulator GlxA family with amidase domain
MIATIDRKLETGASISAVADSLDLSVRTLQRRLFAQGLS